MLIRVLKLTAKLMWALILFKDLNPADDMEDPCFYNIFSVFWNEALRSYYMIRNMNK